MNNAETEQLLNLSSMCLWFMHEILGPVYCRDLATWQEFQSFNVIENYENFENDPWDMMNNFCFHAYTQK